MLARWMIAVVVIVLAGCGGLEPVTPTAPPTQSPDGPDPVPELDVNFNCWVAYFVPVQGVVVDTVSVAPVEGATVTIESYDHDAMRLYACPRIASPLVTTTDANGGFSFESVVMDGDQVAGTTTWIEVSKAGCDRHEELIPLSRFEPERAVEVVLYVTC